MKKWNFFSLVRLFKSAKSTTNNVGLQRQDCECNDVIHALALLCMHLNNCFQAGVTNKRREFVSGAW